MSGPALLLLPFSSQYFYPYNVVPECVLHKTQHSVSSLYFYTTHCCLIFYIKHAISSTIMRQACSTHIVPVVFTCGCYPTIFSLNFSHRFANYHTYTINTHKSINQNLYCRKHLIVKIIFVWFLPTTKCFEWVYSMRRRVYPFVNTCAMIGIIIAPVFWLEWKNHWKILLSMSVCTNTKKCQCRCKISMEEHESCYNVFGKTISNHSKFKQGENMKQPI